ncbi:hypothetical protein EIL87_19685 [Saccharopolyspora rhizosphaerae]|uniref:Uncharacterized protein n=1 Tax=Saccharopolyspora rhizosphaerae TaxID=2492662 RepID=A0A3R8Q7M0_9PSEU|nr:hypothetical protein [Saccharopolyspora rhizosphaerae]RRO14937.1 hypothetical protein EIL87_19685 [Saccharopolyspora rhizosphaerae]
MSWNDFYQRQQALAEVLDNARRDLAAAFATVPGPFRDVDELLAALHHKWMQQLTGRVDVALTDTESAPHGDRVEAVTRAWRNAAKENSGLRAALDVHADHPALDEPTAREHRVLAVAAGLAEEHEPPHDIARVGRAFLQLLRATPDPEQQARPSRLRKLIPSF